MTPDTLPVPVTMAEVMERYQVIRHLLNCTEETAAILALASVLLEK
jgi:hypothetical protein